jgi:hypothetical protein
MKNLLRLIGFFFVMALALPAAAQKIYTLEVTAVNSGTAQIKISNVSPPTESNSTINSFKIRAPRSGHRRQQRVAVGDGDVLGQHGLREEL